MKLNGRQKTLRLVPGLFFQQVFRNFTHPPKFESIKRTIRNHKSADEETFGHPTSAAEIQIPFKYKVTLRDEPFLMFDSGMDDEAIIIFLSCLIHVLRIIRIIRNALSICTYYTLNQ